ncbi:MAG: hypothetical protein COB65_01505 [Thalassobium sp.]|nr:MAG: hypothetical protein COB65_01505 [Thalassobium sp.]
MGYNSGQFHHRKSEEFKAPYIELGLLIKSDGVVSREGLDTYSTFGHRGILFPMYDVDQRLVGLAALRTGIQNPQVEYLNDFGLYPKHPNSRVKKLFIVPSVIDAASLLQADILLDSQNVLALRSGEWTEEHREAILGMKKLKEVVLINSQGDHCIKSHSVVKFDLPDYQSMNQAWLSYGASGLSDLLVELEDSHQCEENGQRALRSLEVLSDAQFLYTGDELMYHITGLIPSNPTLLEMQFEIRVKGSGEILRTKLNLLSTHKLQRVMGEWTELHELNYAQCIVELNHITDELQKLRRVQNQAKPVQRHGFSSSLNQKAKEVLVKEDLLELIDHQLEKSGIVGEHKTRLLLFLVASSYKLRYNLHGVIQSSDVETGADFIKKIAQCLPDVDQYEIDLTTSRSFRYYGNSIIDNKLLVIPDYSGITASSAIDDLKRLQAKGTIVNDSPKKSANGLLYTTKQEVKGHTSSIGSCVKTKKYFENEPRTMMVSMDDSKEQLERLMRYDCQKMAGMVDDQAESKARETLQYIHRNVYSLEVVNPFASQLMLPVDLPFARTLTSQLLNFVNIITLFHQHQRKIDDKGRVVAQKEDIDKAIDLFLSAIIVNIDELDATTRSFFESFKTLAIKAPLGKTTKFSSLQIRQSLSMSKTTVNRHLKTLLDYEYIKKIGYKNTGFSYQVYNWSSMEELKKSLSNQLGGQGEPIKMGR